MPLDKSQAPLSTGRGEVVEHAISALASFDCPERLFLRDTGKAQDVKGTLLESALC